MGREKGRAAWLFFHCYDPPSLVMALGELGEKEGSQTVQLSIVQYWVLILFFPVSCSPDISSSSTAACCCHRFIIMTVTLINKIHLRSIWETSAGCDPECQEVADGLMRT